MTYRGASIAALLAASLALAACQEDEDVMAPDETEETVAGDTSAATTDNGTASSASEEARSQSDAGSASSTASDAATDAAQSGEAPAAEAEATAEQAAANEGTVGAAGDPELGTLLSVEGFDAEAVVERVQTADNMDEAQRAALTTAVQDVDPTNEVALQALIDRLKIAFNTQGAEPE